MNGKTVAILLLGVSCLLVRADESVPPMTALIQKDGEAYRDTKSEIMTIDGVEATLRDIIKDADVASFTRIHAEILLVAIKRANLMEEWDEFFTDRMRENRGTTYLHRPGVLSYLIRSFVYKGPMHKVVNERDGFYRTPKGARRPKYRKVEKFSEQEVEEGIARNAAARWLVAEHLLKFSKNDNDHDQVAFVGAVHGVFSRRDVPKVFERDWPVGETLMRWAMQNDELCVAARLQALRNLKEIIKDHDLEMNDTEVNDFFVVALEKVSNKKSREGIGLLRDLLQMIQGQMNEHLKEQLNEMLLELPKWKQELILEETGIRKSEVSR